MKTAAQIKKSIETAQIKTLRLVEFNKQKKRMGLTVMREDGSKTVFEMNGDVAAFLCEAKANAEELLSLKESIQAVVKEAEGKKTNLAKDVLRLFSGYREVSTTEDAPVAEEKTS